MNSCLAVANGISDADLRSLLERVDGLVDSGVSPNDAQRIAAGDMLAEIEQERVEMMGLLKEQHPDLFAKRKQPEPEPAASETFGQFEDDGISMSQRASTGRVRMSIDKLVEAAESMSQWKDWYERHEDTLAKHFGNDADLFGRLLAATSQAADVRSNVSLALKAYRQYYANQPFEGYLPSVKKNLERIRMREDVGGPKIVGYLKANEGDPDGIAVDRHIARVMFNTTKPNGRQIKVAKLRIIHVAERLGWEPRQVQSALWSYSQTQAGKKDIATYDTLIENRSDEVASYVELAKRARAAAGGFRAFADRARGRAGAGRVSGRAGEGDGSVAEGQSTEEELSFSVRGQYELGGFGAGRRLIEAVQDRYNRWKQAIDEVRAQGGAVSEDNDFYRAEERYWGKVGAQIEDFKGEFEDWVKEVRGDGLDLASVALYAYAEHAKDRNAWIANIRPSMPDGGSGMTNDQADQYIDDARQSGMEPELQKHSAKLRQWIQGTRQIMLDEGLITQDEFDNWTQNMASYVPLRGLPPMSDMIEGKKSGVGQGFNIRGAESKTAMGRRSEAKQIIEHIIADRTRAHIRAGKNEVLRHFLKFVLDNPSPNLWEVDAVENKPASTVDANGDRIIEDRQSIISDDRTVTVKDGGREIHITVRDEKLREQLQNLHVENVGRFIGALLFVNRMLSRVYTSLSPVFTVVNLLRDLQTATFGAIDELGFGGAARMWANMPAALRESLAAEAGSMSADYQLFRSTGGKTGFFDFKTIDDLSREISSIAEMSDRSSLNPRKLAPKMLDLIESVNSGLENTSRLAAFKTARQSGMSVAEAARVSKNLTVNFNRKGAMTPALSAWFLFFNPAVQGTTQMLKALRNPKVMATLGAAMTGMFALALRNAGMGDDDDGVAWYDKIPDEIKERNIIIVHPPGSKEGDLVPGSKVGRYTKVPMPYGYNFFAVLANQVADLKRNAEDPRRGRTAGEAFSRAVGAFMGSWVPMTEVGSALSGDSSTSLVLAAVPDALNPVAQNILNTNPFGRAVHPDGGKHLPDSTKYFAGQAGSLFQKSAELMNSAAGGTPFEPPKGPLALFDMSPGTIENLVRGYGGGPASFTMDLMNAVYARHALERPEIDTKKLPFIKQFTGVIDDETDRMVGYANMEKADAIVSRVKAAKDAGDDEELERMTEEGDPILSLGARLKSTRSKLSKFRKQELAVIADKEMSDGKKVIELQLLNAERRALLQDFNADYGAALVELRKQQADQRKPALPQPATAR